MPSRRAGDQACVEVIHIADAQQDLAALRHQATGGIDVEGLRHEADRAVGLAVGELPARTVVADDGLAEFVDGNRAQVVVMVTRFNCTGGDQAASVGVDHRPAHIGVVVRASDGADRDQAHRAVLDA